MGNCSADSRSSEEMRPPMPDVLPLDWLDANADIEAVVQRIHAPNSDSSPSDSVASDQSILAVEFDSSVTITASECLYDTRLIDGFFDVLEKLVLRIYQSGTQRVRILLSMSRRRSDAEDYFWEKIWEKQ